MPLQSDVKVKKVRIELLSYFSLDFLVGNYTGNREHYSMIYTGNIGGFGFAPIFPDICYHLTHYKPAAADIPVASDNPAHYADAIRYNAR
ncbi:hypothetical protein, partial [Shigella sonnei]|uniref:hypothetical protein n=2 Tax=Shigella sonnei TaxID=624 RepID=UPI001C8BBECD